MANSDSGWAIGAFIVLVFSIGVVTYELGEIRKDTHASVTELQKINASNEQFNELYQESYGD